MPHIQTYPRRYAYTNLVDLVLSNPTNKPETHPLYLDANRRNYLAELIKFKFKGFQVAPAELEAPLLQCPLVEDAAVVGVYVETQATELPRAYVVLRSSLGIDRAKAPGIIADWVQERVAAHKRLRGGVQVIDVIPKSAADKILRKQLREMVQRMSESKL